MNTIGLSPGDWVKGATRCPDKAVKITGIWLVGECGLHKLASAPHIHHSDGDYDYPGYLRPVNKGNGAVVQSPGTVKSLKQEIADMNAISTLKNAKLTPDERFLRVQYLEDNNGVPSGDGMIALNQLLWEREKAGIAKELRTALKKDANERKAYTASISADEDDTDK